MIRYETKELVHYQPCVVELVEQRREVVACSKGYENQIVTAAAPKQILPKIKATEEFLSFLVVSKLDDRQPLYHLERQLGERHGIDCSRQTMARWLIELMTPMRPIYNLLKDSVIDYDVASCDATTLQVFQEPGRKAETKSYVYYYKVGEVLTTSFLTLSVSVEAPPANKPKNRALFKGRVDSSCNFSAAFKRAFSI